MFNNNDDSTSGTTGLLGKFRERINKIRKERMLRKQKFQEEQDEFIKEKIKEIREKKDPRVSNISKRGIVKNTNHKKGVFIRKKEEEQQATPDIKKEQNINNDGIKEQKLTNSNEIRKGTTSNNINNDPITKKSNINGIAVPQSNNPKEKKDEPNKNKIPPVKQVTNGETINKDNSNVKKEDSYDKNKEQQSNLKKKIIKRFKGNFLKKLSELEMLESELYRLNDATSIELELDKIKEIKKEISSIIKKINTIIREYNIYNSCFDLYDTVDLSDNLLIDDIINYKYLIDNYTSQKEMVREYKLLDEFKKLYQKLDQIKSLSDEVIENNQAKLNYLEEKKKDKEDVNQNIKELNGVMTNCNEEITNQNEYLKELMKKVGEIDKKEYTHLKLISLTPLINSTVMFLGSLSLTKKMPLVSKIFINSLATYNLLKNIYHSLVPEATKEIKYTAINYDKEITSKINDIDYTSQLLSDTLSTINLIKEQFLIKYDTNLPGFDETLNKITNIEDNILKNQYKIDTIKNNLDKSRKQNEEKMLKLEKLNNNN